MRFITTELQAKINDGTATETERVVHKLLSAVGDVSPEEAAQKLLQAEAICDAKDQGHHSSAEALLELFCAGEASVRRGVNGFEYRLTDAGIARAATLMRQLGQPLH